MQNIRIVIYSPSYIIRKGLASIIKKIQGIKNVISIDLHDELVEIINQSDFDFYILDSEINQQKDLIKILAKKINPEQLIFIINDVNYKSLPSNFKNTIHINDSQVEILENLNNLIGNTAKVQSKSDLPEEISKREADILKYIALGFSNKEIADKLFISAHTVVTHRKNITRKLGIKTAPGLTIYAILNNIIDINDTEKI